MTRSEILRAYGLSDQKAFDVEPRLSDDGNWEVVVNNPVYGLVRLTIEQAESLAQALAQLDPNLSVTLIVQIERARARDQRLAV